MEVVRQWERWVCVETIDMKLFDAAKSLKAGLRVLRRGNLRMKA
jgi:hypothetical protein